MKTNKDIVYNFPFGQKAIIPKGTKVIKAINLPSDNTSKIAYWVCPWKGMIEADKSHMRTYGFGLSANDVED